MDAVALSRYWPNLLLECVCYRNSRTQLPRTIGLVSWGSPFLCPVLIVLSLHIFLERSKCLRLRPLFMNHHW